MIQDAIQNKMQELIKQIETQHPLLPKGSTSNI